MGHLCTQLWNPCRKGGIKKKPRNHDMFKCKRSGCNELKQTAGNLQQESIMGSEKADYPGTFGGPSLTHGHPNTSCSNYLINQRVKPVPLALKRWLKNWVPEAALQLRMYILQAGLWADKSGLVQFVRNVGQMGLFAWSAREIQNNIRNEWSALTHK